MNSKIQIRTLLLAGLLSCTGPVIAAEGDPLTKDLTSTISLLGLPCGQVVSVVTQANRDYIATCSDKNRYRIYLNPQGKVAAEKR